MVEIWKDIPNYEGLYQASNQGRIRNATTGKIRKLVPYGFYYTIQLSKNGKNKLWLVHRLIAITFIPNPNNKPQINHIDANMRNNCVENLEWTTQSENIKHAYNLGRMTKEHLEKLHNNARIKNSKPILQLKQGKIIARYNSLREVSRLFGYSTGALSSCANGKYKTMYGYEWRYEL